MADEEAKKLLSDWALAEYIPNFEKNKVTYKVIPLLDESMVKDLIPVIGDRAVFNMNCKKHYQKETDNHVLADCSNTEKKRKLKAGGSNSKGVKVQKVNDSNDCEERDSDDADSPHGVLVHIWTSPGAKRLITELHKLTKRTNNYILEEISNNIIREFPSETLSGYYIPPVKRKNSGILNRSIVTRGKIVNKWRNMVTSLKPPKNDDIDVISSQENQQESCTDQEIVSSIQWLKDNANAPLKEVALNHWEHIAALRTKEFINCEDKNIVNIYEKWSILHQTNGFQLIISDFNYLQYTKIEINNDNWNTFFQSIKDLCNDRKKDERTKFLKNLLNEENLSNDSRVSIQLLLLPHYIPSKAISKIRADSSKEVKTWKITIGDTKDSILQLAKVEGDTEVIKERRIKFAQDHKQSLQPYLIIVGEDLTNIQHAYVCVDKTLYTVSSVLQAVDICFKSFHVFNLVYPIESKHIWLIIQKCFYKFRTQYDEVLSYTEHLIMEFEKNSEKVINAYENPSDHSSNDEDKS